MKIDDGKENEESEWETPLVKVGDSGGPLTDCKVFPTRHC